MFDFQLSQLGFTGSEALVYIELLTIGPQPVSVIAKRIRFNRTSTYAVLKSLERKGVVSSFVGDGIKTFSPNDPNCLVAYLDRKSRVLDYHRGELLSLIPKFRELSESYEFRRPLLSYFDGIEGVKHVMYDALKASNDFFAYLSIDKWLDSGLEDFLIKYKDFRIFDKNIPLKAIVADLPRVRSFFSKHYRGLGGEMTELLYLDPDVYAPLFENEMNIYDGKVSIINLARGAEYGMIIESKEIANMQKVIFEMAWKAGSG